MLFIAYGERFDVYAANVPHVVYLFSLETIWTPYKKPYVDISGIFHTALKFTFSVAACSPGILRNRFVAPA